MRGLMANGEEAEISAADCKDVSLTEVLSRVGRIMAATLAEKREAREMVQWLNGKCQIGET